MRACALPLAAAAAAAAAGRATAPAGAACTDASSCSLNGRCTQGACVCDEAWHGASCELLALQPTPAQSDYDARASMGLSTWGASVVQLPSDGQRWHMYVSEFRDGCGVTSWQTNSQIVHVVGTSPTGPWRREGVALHAWSHCGTVAVAPDGVMIQPRLWCSPAKYANGTGSCNAGVRSTVPAGMPNAGQRCVGGASPCGFHLHEGAWVPCPGANGGGSAPASELPQREPVRATAPCRPGSGARSSISFAVSRTGEGEWTENFTAPIVGPNLCPGEHSLGTMPPWIMPNGTTWILVLPQLIRAERWNGSYTVCECSNGRLGL